MSDKGVNGIADHKNKDFSAKGLHFWIKGANVHDHINDANINPNKKVFVFVSNKKWSPHKHKFFESQLVLPKARLRFSDAFYILHCGLKHS